MGTNSEQATTNETAAREPPLRARVAGVRPAKLGAECGQGRKIPKTSVYTPAARDSRFARRCGVRRVALVFPGALTAARDAAAGPFTGDSGEFFAPFY